MKKLCAMTWLMFILAGCGSGSGPAGSPQPVIVPLPSPGVIVLAPIDGEWVIIDEFGDRFCITIQEARISVINDGCRTDGLGFARRIFDAPEAVLAGRRIVITAEYNPLIYSEATTRISFNGELQLDGSYEGTLIVEEFIPADGTPDRPFPEQFLYESPAVMALQ